MLDDDAQPEANDDDGPAVPSMLAGARPVSERVAPLFADDEEEPPPSAVRTTSRPPAPPASVVAPSTSSSVVIRDGKKFFVLDGELYELHPVRATSKGAPKPRGLAALSPERRSEIGRKGGRATAKSSKAVRSFERSELAKAAGRKGGLAKARNARDVSSAAE